MRGRGTRCDGRGVPRQGIETVAAGRRAYHGMGLAIEEGGRLAGEFWLGAADRNRRQQCMCVCVCVCVSVSEKERRKGDLPTWKSRETAAGVGGMRRGRRLMQLLEESFCAMDGAVGDVV
jgi:hypothetical protein